MHTSKKIIGILLVVVVLVLLNGVGRFFPFRVDLTEDKIFTLSEGSHSMVKALEEPVTMEFFFSRSEEALPVFWKNYATRVEEMLKQYVAASDGMITLSIIDPEPDTEEEEQAVRARVRGQPLPSGRKVYFGLNVLQSDQQETIPFFNPEKEEFLEYDISKLIYGVQILEKPKMGIYTGLPLFDSAVTQPGTPTEPRWRLLSQWEQNFEVIELKAKADFKKDIDMLLVLHPTSVPPDIEYAIDQFILSGRPTVVAVDPASDFKRRNRPPQMAFLGQQSPLVDELQKEMTSNLPTLFSHYGIRFNPMELVADKEYPVELPTGDGRSFPFPLWLILKPEALEKGFLPVAQLQNVLLVEAGTLSTTEDSRLKMQPVIKTSNRTKLYSSAALERAMAKPEQILNQIEDDGDVYTLAGYFTGTVTSAFPDGAPKVEAPEGDEQAEAAPEETEAPLKASEGDVKLFVIADSDWLQERYSIRVIEFLGQEAIEPITDNYAFAINLGEYFSGSNDLISIRSKRQSVRPFKRVEAINKVAQEKFLKAEEELQAQYDETEQKLNQLLSEQSGARLLAISPEMQEAINEIQDKKAEIGGKLRDIRKKAREDVETLERNLILANMLIVPGLVILFGILFFVIRSRNQ